MPAQPQAAAATPESSLPAVTIFKPVHGMEAQLEENLESFFQQDYPAFEIVLGARDASDAGLQLAEKIRQRYPQVKSRIVVSGPPTWPNAKVFSLSKMIPLSANDYFVISDSDVRVSPDFLRHVIPALLDPEIGLVTCPYRGVTAGDFWSTLEALGMSVEMPSGVMVADMLEGIRFALGPAVALRRDALDKIGGIAATADYYSDDFVLGNLIWAAGYKVIFSHHIIQHVLTPRSLKRTLGDQLRWMKSTRFSRPLGHVGTGLTYAMPFGVLGLVSAAAMGHLALGVGLFAAAFINRVVQSIAVGWGIIGDRRALYLVVALSGPRFAGLLYLAGQFRQPHFFLARRNLPLQPRRQNRSAKSGCGECPGSEAVGTGRASVPFRSSLEGLVEGTLQSCR